jgi:ketosteroid isomerase-like protein
VSPVNTDIVRQQIDAANRRDLDAFVALVSPDVEWEDSMFWSEPTQVYRGRAELRGWLERVIEPWESLHFDVEELTEAADDLVFGGARLTTRGKGSGVETQIRGWFLFRLATGKITARQVFLDREEGLRAAGLSST